MKKIDFEVAGKRYCYSVPERWEEMTADHFRMFVDVGTFDIELVRRIIGMADVVASSLTVADWWALCQEFKWMKDTENVGKLFIEEIKLPDGTVCYGYSADFSDVLWEEWMFADTYASKGQWNVVAAVLYRPERLNWNHETDRRIPFTKHGAADRANQTAKLDELTLRCVQVNYLLLRKRLTNFYSKMLFDPDDEDKSIGKKEEATSWLSIIRTMMGDNFYEEQKYYQLSVPSVLFHSAFTKGFRMPHGMFKKRNIFISK